MLGTRIAPAGEEPMVCGLSPLEGWREMDSNFQYAGAVNLVVSPFGWVVLCDRVRAGRGASGTARYQRRGWAILAAGLGAAHRRSDLWCARLGSTRSDDCLFNAASNDITRSGRALNQRMHPAIISSASARSRRASLRGILVDYIDVGASGSPVGVAPDVISSASPTAISPPTMTSA